MQKLTDRYERIHPFDYPYLVPVLSEYRKKMMVAIGMKPSEGYNRIFTEMRMFGARTKYWGVTRYFRTTSMLDYVAAHPTITMGSDVFEVEMRRVQGCSDYALYVNRLRQVATPKEVICEGVKAAFTALNQEINNTINTQNMQNSETTNNTVNNGINIGTPTIGTPYKQHIITIPVALPTGVTFEYRGVVENANPEEFEVIDHEWSAKDANGAVVAQTLNVMLGGGGYGALLKDLDARAIALANAM